MSKINFKNILAGVGGLSVVLFFISISIFSFADYPILNDGSDSAFSDSTTDDLSSFNYGDDLKIPEYYIDNEGNTVLFSPDAECIPKIAKKFTKSGEIPLDINSLLYSNVKSLVIDGIKFEIIGNSVIITFPNGTKQTLSFLRPFGLYYDQSRKSLWVTDLGANKIINYKAVCVEKKLTIAKDLLEFDYLKGKYFSSAKDKFVFDFTLNGLKFSLSDGGSLPDKKDFKITDSQDYTLTEVLNKYVGLYDGKIIQDFMNRESDKKFVVHYIGCKDSSGKTIIQTQNYGGKSNILELKAENINDDIICTVYNNLHCTWLFTNSIVFPKNGKALPLLLDATGFSVGGFGFLGTGYYINGGYTKDWFKFTPGKYDYQGGQYGGTWSRMKPFPGEARKAAIGFALNGKGYLGFGTSASGQKLRDLWEYDFNSDSWTRKNDFWGEGFENGIFMTVGDVVYVGLGRTENGKLSNKMLAYDPSGDTWDFIPAFPGSPREGAVAFGIGSKGYVGTGRDANGKDLADFYEISGGIWTKKKDFPGGPTFDGYGFSLEGKGYIGGGSGMENDFEANDFWQFDPNGDAGEESWEQMHDRFRSSMPADQKNVVLIINGNAYIHTGGWDDEDDTNGFYMYRPCP